MDEAFQHEHDARRAVLYTERPSADRIIEAARISFVDGAWAAYLVGGIAIALGFLVVLLGLPSPAEERRLRERYAREDAPVA